MRIAITGASGFIGSALTKRLRASGHSVYEVSTKELKSGMPTLAAKAEVMIHCAAAGAQPPRDSLDIIYQNQALLGNAFRMAREAKLFINFGSSSEYGIKNKPMSETDVLEPVGPYAVSKAMCTLLAAELGRHYKKNVVTVRPFSVYGHGEADHRFIPTVCRSLVRKEPMCVSSGEAHDWIFIDDFCDAVEIVIALNIDECPLILNIGTGYQRTNSQIIAELEDISGRLVEGAEKETIANMWCADNARLEKMGWKQTHFIEPKQDNQASGLAKTYEYYKSKYANEKTK